MFLFAICFFFFFSSRRRHTRLVSDWSSDVCSSDLVLAAWRRAGALGPRRWIPGGGAHPHAVVGQLLGGLELASQVAAPPDAIVLPLGTGGTAAGLALAVAAAGWPARILGVRVGAVFVA